MFNLKNLNGQRGQRLLSLVGVLMIAFTCIESSCVNAGTQTSLTQALSDSWHHFKVRFMENGCKVVSQTYGGVISEGQSYAMLMAWRMNDRLTFEKTWQWTRTHMRRPNDALLAWQWGKKPDGTQGIVDENNATDADQDIAYVLVKAGNAWNRPDYVREGKALIQALWQVNVIKLTKRYYLTAGPWEGVRSNGMLHQPVGYFAPHVYRLFASMDPQHPWQQLLEDGYDWLEACSQLSPAGLPPNWCGIQFQDEKATWSDVQGEGSRDFSYDGIRLFWRMAQDRDHPEARAYTLRHQALNHFWEKNGAVPGGFNADGTPQWDTPTSYGRAALVAQWLVMSGHKDGNSYYQRVLASQYHTTGYWQKDDNYFLSAVVWLSLSTGVKDW
jgi:endoglucanase